MSGEGGAVSLRLFIAFELTEMQKQDLAVLQDRVKGYIDGVRWLRPVNMHLTLKFLGEIGEESTGLIKKAMNRTIEEFRPFKIQFGGCGVFPTPQNARVLWIGLKKGEEPIKELAGRLENNLSKYEFKKEDRRYQPHLTIGRLRNRIPQEKINQFLEQEKLFETTAEVAQEIVLFQSCLAKQGAIHTAMHNAVFKGN